MNFTTNVKLFAKGYSFEDIKALNNLEGITDELALECADKELNVEDIKNLSIISTPETENDNSEGGNEPPNNDIDYKALYEAEKQKVENLQRINVNAPAGKDEPPKSDFDRLSELMKNVG